MSDEEDFMQKARTRFDELCRALNMDEEASTEAWRSYENISRNFTLEGSELHWLACALYVACRSSVPTVGKGTAEGNYVSLTRILRCSEMSLIEFFSKLKKWQDMANLPQDFRRSTDKLERNFTVSAVIFKKYVPIFKSIFKAPSEEPARVHRSRKQRRHPCTVTEVFNFCWVLFVHAKGNFPMISDDLVNSYHLLLCAFDLVLTNALLCNARKELLNPEFKGLPEDFTNKDFRPSAGPFCFVQQLCELHDGLVLEAKGVKEHFWKPFIRKLFHKRILRGKEDSLTGFLDPMNFGDSFLSLSRLYEEHVLATGSLDERIFTGEGANDNIGTPGPCLCEGMENQDSNAYRLSTNLTASVLKVSTPLTGRKYIQEIRLSSPLSSAMKSVGRLHTLLSGTKHGPSAKLAEILRCVEGDQRSTALLVIEVLVRSEQGLSREVVKHLNQVEEQVLESLAWTSGSPLWQSLRTAKVPSCQEVMPPQYLEQNEETSTGSVSHTPIKAGSDLRANSIIKGVSPSPTSLQDRYSSPPSGGFRRRLFVDPVEGEPSVTATQQSAVPKTGIVTAFPAGQTVFTVTTNSGQTMTIPLQGIANESGSITLIPVQMSGATLQPLSAQTLTGTLAIQSPVTKPAAKAASSSLRKGSLSLFFRKVYHMASVRLRDLCAKLDISSELRRRIWTCFEYSVVHCTEMMNDRHLDQLLMCAVYVTAKVSKEDRSFQDIMRCYRTQPQAKSHVYRSVLISGRRRPALVSDDPKTQSSAANSSKDSGGKQLPAPCSKEEEGAKGRNSIYSDRTCVSPVKLKAIISFSPQAETPPLCPYPSLRTGSPRRMLLSSKHSIYISPHRTPSSPSPTTGDRISYYICTSPPNRLQEINSMIRTGETPTRKRSIPLDEEASPKRVCPDNHTSLLRRLQDIANDRSSSH
ncbi:PREDICTED: retinoblastoma-like protein 2 [Cyprinodon variegatus]|uniref:retinoblastoma-like protein 2 n=1 Tax=Cyprinodon variegatus TaxID=28743 RepID=UPI0007429D1F|nr:PREDICTED: retinoblastoma-like protein 2 [Cyprinodon variegatus]